MSAIKVVSGVLTTVGITFGVCSAHASTIDLSSPTQVIYGQGETLGVGGFTVSANDGSVLVQNEDGIGIFSQGDSFDYNGFPIDYPDGNYDQVNSEEVLSFVSTDPVEISSIEIAQIFDEIEVYGQQWADETGTVALVTDSGLVSVDFDGQTERYQQVTWSSWNGTTYTFTATWDHADEGNIVVNFDQALQVTEMSFTSGNDDPWKGYSVKSFGTTTSVPELNASTAAMSLTLLLGFGVVATERRRRLNPTFG